MTTTLRRAPNWLARLALAFLARASLSTIAATTSETPARPNILFIIIDDHPSNMTSVLHDSPVHTPNIERLAARGTWFTHAYANVPTCAASRASFLTGVAAWKSGVYFNRDGFRRTTTPIARAVTMQRHFLDHGYLTAGYGKIAHTAFQDDNLGDYTPGYFQGHAAKKYVRHDDNDLVRHIIPETLRVPDPTYLPTRFGALPDDWDRDDPAKLQQDTEQANRAIAFLRASHEQPFFLSLGFWRPHSERIVPKRYFDLYPLESIQIPPSFRADDLDDVPAPGRRQATHQGTHAAVVNAGLLREYLRSYYASVSYVDEQIGRVLDALESSPHARNTIVVFSSDNGYNAGEKNMWAKFALWEQTCRVSLAISGPGLPRQIASTPVSLLDIYPTLVDLCGLPRPSDHELDGIDLAPILKGEKQERGQPVVSIYGEGNRSITDGRFRYISYRNGDEELYDLDRDRYEWTNLAHAPKYAAIKAGLARLLPAHDAPEIEPSGRRDGSELDAETFRQIATAPVGPALLRETDFNRPIRVACIGDSITYGHLLPQRERNSYPAQLQALLGEQWRVENFGHTGATLLRKSPRPFLEQPEYTAALAFQPDVVVLQLGTNDTQRQTWETEGAHFIADYLELIRSFQALESKPRIVLCRPLPLFRDRGQDWDTDRVLRDQILPKIDEVARQARLPLINLNAIFADVQRLMPDGVHPSTEGAALMARTVYTAITGKPAAK
jgi:arylsulfatase A-like enzyme/lysophospholipase L1-like esterase